MSSFPTADRRRSPITITDASTASPTRTTSSERGRWGPGLDGVALLAVTVTSGLPTAQNVVVYALAYGEPRDPGAVVARDVIMLSTILSVPVLVGISVLLG